MFSPLKAIRKIHTQYKMLQNIENAEKFYWMQKAAIEDIKLTRWYEEIHDFFAREFDLCINDLCRLKSSDISDYKGLQARLNTSREFLEFLENISEG